VLALARHLLALHWNLWRDGIARMRPTRLVADPERAQDIA